MDSTCLFDAETADVRCSKLAVSELGNEFSCYERFLGNRK